MNRIKLWTIAVALSGVAAGALADDPHEAALARAKEAGKPVLFVYTRPTTCPLAKGAQSHMLHSAVAKRDIHPHFIVAEIAIAQGGKRYSDYLNKFPAKFIPFWVVATPDGTYIDGGDYETVGASGEAGWAKRVAKLAKDYPPVSAADRETARKMITQARADMAAGRYVQAMQAATKLKKVWYPESLVTDCEKLREDIAAAATKMLAEAKALEEKKDFLEAAVIYDRLVRLFGPTSETGKEAAKRLNDLLKAHKEVRPQLQARRQEAQAEELLSQAAAAEKAGDAKKARVLYVKLLSRYRTTPSAPKAKEAIERIDAAVRAARGVPAKTTKGNSDEDAATALVKLARSYYGSGLVEKAKAKLTECISKYPKTKAATEAGKLLKQWGPSGG